MRALFRLTLRDVCLELRAQQSTSDAVFRVVCNFVGGWKEIPLSTDKATRLVSNDTSVSTYAWRGAEFVWDYHTSYVHRLREKHFAFTCSRVSALGLTDEALGDAAVSLYMLATGPQHYDLQLTSSERPSSPSSTAGLSFTCAMVQHCKHLRFALSSQSLEGLDRLLCSRPSSDSDMLKQQHNESVTLQLDYAYRNLDAVAEQEAQVAPIRRTLQVATQQIFQDSASVPVPHVEFALQAATAESLRTAAIYVQIKLLAHALAPSARLLAQTFVPLLYKYKPGAMVDAVTFAAPLLSSSCDHVPEPTDRSNSEVAPHTNPDLAQGSAHKLHTGATWRGHLRLENGPRFRQMAGAQARATDRGVACAGTVMVHFPIPDRWEHPCTVTFENQHTILHRHTTVLCQSVGLMPQPTLTLATSHGTSWEKRRQLLWMLWQDKFGDLLRQRQDAHRQLAVSQGESKHATPNSRDNQVLLAQRFDRQYEELWQSFRIALLRLQMAAGCAERLSSKT